jgi:dipeptidase
MPCTTILVGKKASYNGSTMIARNDDSPTGQFHAKKLVVVDPKDQPRHYKSVISHVEVELPENPLRYTAMPNVDKAKGIWAAAGINELNVAMTATETITSNPRVMGADPYVEYKEAKDGKAEVKGGIGEEELVVLVLPYIKSAREGALRLGALLEQYGTYEPNGIAFSDKDEIWWLESIGGHHWIARKVKDDEYVVMPNQFGLDRFDFADAYGAKKENLCSPDLKDFVRKNHLDLNLDGKFNPRLAFGSHADSDHVYNTPRAWFIERYLNPRTFKWDGPDAQYGPEADDIPWSLVPEKKITIEDVKYVLSSHFQGTPYDPYSKVASPLKGIYRPIGISRTSFMSIAEIRSDLPKEFAAVEWICFASNAFNAMVPLYANMKEAPTYFGNTTSTVSTDNFYWASRLLSVIADAHFGLCGIQIERYQDAVAERSHALLDEYEAKLLDSKNREVLIQEANAAFSAMALEETNKALDSVIYVASCAMKNGFARSDN